MGVLSSIKLGQFSIEIEADRDCVLYMVMRTTPESDAVVPIGPSMRQDGGTEIKKGDTLTIDVPIEFQGTLDESDS